MVANSQSAKNVIPPPGRREDNLPIAAISIQLVAPSIQTLWILEFRLKALEIFKKKRMPTNWADKDLDNINFDKIRYYLSKGQVPARSWDDVPDDDEERACAVQAVRELLVLLLHEPTEQTWTDCPADCVIDGHAEEITEERHNDEQRG